MHNPLSQFEIKPLIPIELFGLDLSFTNAAAFMLAATLLAIFIFYVLTRNLSVIPSRCQIAAEMLYRFIKNMVIDTLGIGGFPLFHLL